jgi:hypothetical protein
MRTKIAFIVLINLITITSGYTQSEFVKKLYILDTIYYGKKYEINILDNDNVWSESLKRSGVILLKNDSLDLKLNIFFNSRFKKFLDEKISGKLSDDEYRTKLCTLVMKYYTNSENNPSEQYSLSYDAESKILFEKIRFLKNNRVICKYTVFLENGVICYFMFFAKNDKSIIQFIEDYLYRSLIVKTPLVLTLKN